MWIFGRFFSAAWRLPWLVSGRLSKEKNANKNDNCALRHIGLIGVNAFENAADAITETAFERDDTERQSKWHHPVTRLPTAFLFNNASPKLGHFFVKFREIWIRKWNENPIAAQKAPFALKSTNRMRLWETFEEITSDWRCIDLWFLKWILFEEIDPPNVQSNKSAHMHTHIPTSARMH